jgi:hypothetical protein
MATITDIFRELCWSRARLWRSGEIAKDHGGDTWIGHAVDPLQAWAVKHELTRELGVDAVQAIMAKAFADE